ncbi:uncharacterized protein LOC111884427 [Lactuca sativa]|uniref:uncharacterized protein LOC111884427 n=1 Tax=Lactuca sativa TaxID=4236 RepID=UPI000CD9890D|nr:uncharacterized protein LOC111884427 [Lactuca sativa]
MTSTPPSSTIADKPTTTINIKNAIPLVLDLDQKSLAPFDEWIRLDSIVKSWIYSTLSQSLLHMILKKKNTASGVWNDLEKLFRDNKDSKSIQLDNEIRNITIGDSSITDYCTHIKSLADLLENLDILVPKKNLVAYTINGLSPKFHYITTTIRHRSPLTTFMKTCSMLLVKEQHMLQDQQNHVSFCRSDNAFFTN